MKLRLSKLITYLLLIQDYDQIKSLSKRATSTKLKQSKLELKRNSGRSVRRQSAFINLSFSVHSEGKTRWRVRSRGRNGSTRAIIVRRFILYRRFDSESLTFSVLRNSRETSCWYSSGRRYFLTSSCSVLFMSHFILS